MWMCLSRSGGDLCILEEEKAAVTAEPDGFYFCSSIYEDDEGKSCMRTSELIEIPSGTLPVSFSSVSRENLLLGSL